LQLFDDEMKNLLLQRLIERKERGGMAPIYRLDPTSGQTRKYTPDDQITEARNGTAIGNEILMAEKVFHDYLKKV
jgi:hypothetical protein